jgi:uncharacterized membrane protein
METKKNKYDTNPLDPDVERKSEEAWGKGAGGSPTTEWVQEPTREVNLPAGDSGRKNVYSEAPTRRYDSPPLEAPYPSVFVPPPYAPPNQYQPKENIYQPPASANRQSSSGSVAGIGIPEKWAVMMPYAPFYIGLVFSLVELFTVPRKEARVRFHASQALALHATILVIHTFFGVISTVTDTHLGGTIFKACAFAYLVMSMIKVSRGDAHRIAPLAEPAQWFNEHIEPRNQR